MKFVKPCPPDSRHISCGYLQALQSSVPGFPAHILRTPANSAKLCPRIPGTYPADIGKFCKALSPDSRHTSCGHRQILQSSVPGFPAHILRTPASSAKLCPWIPGTYPCGHRQALQSSAPGHGKAGRHDYGYSLQKKNGGKTAVPDTLCFF